MILAAAEVQGSVYLGQGQEGVVASHIPLCAECGVQSGGVASKGHQTGIPIIGHITVFLCVGEIVPNSFRACKWHYWAGTSPPLFIFCILCSVFLVTVNELFHIIFHWDVVLLSIASCFWCVHIYIRVAACVL